MANGNHPPPLSASPKLFERGESVFDPGDRPALPDQAVDSAGPRVGAAVQREDHLPGLFVDPHEANLKPPPVKRHLMMDPEI